MAALREELKSRQQSYIRREGRYREQIEELQATAERATQSRAGADGSSALQRNGVYALHQKVLASINGVVETAEHKQKAAEKDAMQTFRARQGGYSTGLSQNVRDARTRPAAANRPPDLRMGICPRWRACGCSI